ncbi:MAG: DUF1232 domain-containing protein [Rhizobiaceae bacterium]|nr:DUF1232 domain-containing protein [Rhizobiaceae bacterium]MCV0405842.1 DUF1232 domain-containing protein [Rhizobiaceae bacterium]
MEWARAVRRDVIALWLAARDPRTPWHVRLVAAFVAAYALSPLDLIPDFIPIVGYLDDIVLLPLGILVVVHLMPSALMAELRTTASRTSPPVSKLGAAAVILAWIVIAAWLIWLFRPVWSQ